MGGYGSNLELFLRSIKLELLGDVAIGLCGCTVFDFAQSFIQLVKT